MSVFKTLSHISKTPCKFSASIRVLQAEMEEELRPEMATFQVTLSRGTKIIYSKKSWREGKVVQWNPKGTKSAHRSGVLEFEPMLYLNTKTKAYDKKVYLLTLDSYSTGKGSRPVTLSTFEMDVAELVNSDKVNEERITLTFDPNNNDHERKYNVKCIAQGGVTLTMEVTLRSSSKEHLKLQASRVAGAGSPATMRAHRASTSELPLRKSQSEARRDPSLDEIDEGGEERRSSFTEADLKSRRSNSLTDLPDMSGRSPVAPTFTQRAPKRMSLQSTYDAPPGNMPPAPTPPPPTPPEPHVEPPPPPRESSAATSHSVGFTLTLRDMTPRAFTEDTRTDFMRDLAANLEVEADRVQIRGYSAGSLVVDTRILGMKSVSEASAMASRVKRKTSSGALLSPRFGPCTTANIATVVEEPDTPPSATAPVPADLSSMSIKELKRLANERGVALTGVLEKADIVNAIEASLQPIPAMRAPSYAGMGEAEALRESEVDQLGATNTPTAEGEYLSQRGGFASTAEVRAEFSGTSYTMAEPVVAQRVETAVDATPIEQSAAQLPLTWAVNDIKSFVDQASTTNRGSAELAAALDENTRASEEAAARGASALRQRKQATEAQFAVTDRVTNRVDPRAAAVEDDDEANARQSVMEESEEEEEHPDSDEEPEMFVGPAPADWSAAAMRLHRHGRSLQVTVHKLDFDVAPEEVKQTFYVSIFVNGMEKQTHHTPNLVGWKNFRLLDTWQQEIVHIEKDKVTLMFELYDVGWFWDARVAYGRKIFSAKDGDEDFRGDIQMYSAESGRMLGIRLSTWIDWRP